MSNFFPIKDLKRADYNPRVMPDAEMQALMKSIETHGFVEPIVVNVHPDRYGTIVGGHQRLTAVERLLAKDAVKGLEIENGFWMIPAFEVNLDLEAEKQLNIGLNKIHGKFDEDKLFDLILNMQDSPTLSSTGFTEGELSAILDRGEGREKSSESHTFKTECVRCLELKLQVLGHAKRSGHSIGFQENTDK